MMLGAIVAVVVSAASPAAEWEDVPAAGRARPVETGTPPPTQAAAPAAAADGDPYYPPELPAAPAGPPLADVAPLLLSRAAGPGGHAVERLIEASGDIVEHEVNAAGTVQSCRTVGSLQALPLVAQQPTAGGEYLQVARDASGALVQFVVSRDGEPRAVVVAPAN